MSPSRNLAQLAAAALLAVAAAVAQAQEAEVAKKPPAVVIEEVVVEPAAPGPDTLCRLTVKLKNSGSKIASLFAFTVEIDGHELPVYAKEIFAFPVDPGAAADLRLFNFWSTETGRPAPAGGQLTVAVRLEEARWMEITSEEEVEVWTPAGAVEGLPSAASVTLKMKK